MQRMNNKQQCARSERPTNNKTQKRQKKEKTNNNNNYKVFGYLSNDLSVFAECAQANRARRRARDCSVRCDHCMFSLANSFLFIPFSNSNSCALISFRFIYFPFLFTLCGAPYVCIVLLRLRRAGMRVNELVMFSSRAHCINAAALSAVTYCAICDRIATAAANGIAYGFLNCILLCRLIRKVFFIHSFSSRWARNW